MSLIGSGYSKYNPPPAVVEYRRATNLIRFGLILASAMIVFLIVWATTDVFA